MHNEFYSKLLIVKSINLIKHKHLKENHWKNDRQDTEKVKTHLYRTWKQLGFFLSLIFWLYRYGFLFKNVITMSRNFRKFWNWRINPKRLSKPRHKVREKEEDFLMHEMLCIVYQTILNTCNELSVTDKHILFGGGWAYSKIWHGLVSLT